MVAFVGDFEDFGPGEAIDAQLVAVDEQTARTHAQHDLHVLAVLKQHDSTRLFKLKAQIPVSNSLVRCACRRRTSPASWRSPGSASPPVLASDLCKVRRCT